MKILMLTLAILNQLIIPFPFFDADKYKKEVEQLWESLEDLYHPTLGDYKKIDAYLKTRTFYPSLRNSYREKQILRFQLLGPEDTLPILEKHAINVTDKTQDRCILIYASQNGLYPEKARNLLIDLKEKGYSGHVLLQIGGFPNTEYGGIKLCHIPYAFKVAFFDYAKRLGYKEVLWMDTSLHLLSNLEVVFSEIEKRGYFFSFPGSLSDNGPSHWEEAALPMGVTYEMYPQIPHIWSGLFGFNMGNPDALQAIDEWLRETKKVVTSISGFPEELSLSIVAWRLGLNPVFRTDTIVCNESELHFLLAQKPTLQVYIDPRR